MKVAIVCDWLTNIGGAEKVLLAIHELYPKAPIIRRNMSKRELIGLKKQILELVGCKFFRLLGEEYLAR